jgi:hypothetical protein
MDQGQRQRALERVRQLHKRLRQALSVLHETETRLNGPRLNAQRDCDIIIRRSISEENDYTVLQSLVFTDIVTLDECVMALTEWNNLLREAYDILREAQSSLYLIVSKKYETLFAMEVYLHELHKVITRCILCLGQLSPKAD